MKTPRPNAPRGSTSLAAACVKCTILKEYCEGLNNLPILDNINKADDTLDASVRSGPFSSQTKTFFNGRVMRFAKGSIFLGANGFSHLILTLGLVFLLNNVCASSPSQTSPPPPPLPRRRNVDRILTRPEENYDYRKEKEKEDDLPAAVAEGWKLWQTRWARWRKRQKRQQRQVVPTPQLQPVLRNETETDEIIITPNTKPPTVARPPPQMPRPVLLPASRSLWGGKLGVDLGFQRFTRQVALAEEEFPIILNDQTNETEMYPSQRKRERSLVVSHATDESHRHPRLPRGGTKAPLFKNETGTEVSLTIDTPSLIRLAWIFATMSQSLLVATVGTLRLLAPMIVARKVLLELLYVAYDSYTGRYLRTTYEKGLKDARKFELPAALRALARIVTSLIVAAAAGSVAAPILKIQASMCRLPGYFCRSWSTVAWMLSVFAADRLTHALMLKSKRLKIEPVRMPKSYHTPGRVFVRPWRVLQWMRDPEEWISSNLETIKNDIRRFEPAEDDELFQMIGRSTSILPQTPRPWTVTGRKGGRSRNVPAMLRPDPLLFPSTWAPLRAVTCSAVLLAVLKSNLWGSFVHANNFDWRVLLQRRRGILVLRQWMLTMVLDGEWNRLLLREHRVALAGAVHGVSLLTNVALLWTASLVDGRAGLLIAPSLVAGVFSAWMHVLLYWEKRLQFRRRRGPRLPRRKRQNSPVKPMPWKTEEETQSWRIEEDEEGPIQLQPF